ncbi:MAG: ATP-binding protein [Chitinophagaceae bacterium]|nr:ATP-binding protein [Chitinophagaceae bacterium]
MINKIHIKNFKSVYDLEIELGRFNVFIGENGCGKTNILEAIAFGGTILNTESLDGKLPNERLFLKGFRNAETIDSLRPQFNLQRKNSEMTYEVFFSPEEYLKFSINKKIEAAISSYSKKSNKIIDETEVKAVIKKSNSLLDKVLITLKKMEEQNKVKENKQLENNEKKQLDNLRVEVSVVTEHLNKFIKNAEIVKKTKSVKSLNRFILFAPENSYLRKFEDEFQSDEIGFRGDGLFKVFKKIYFNEPKLLSEIIKNLGIIDWFKNLEIPDDNFPGESKIKIEDKYLMKDSLFLDQKTANEGFLFLLFYLTLFISKDTPNFFAIDNIEASFNPKLCVELTKNLTKLSKEHKKQAIVTTHNPFILDGLDLSDDNQRLFVVRRNLDGHTIATRVKPTSKTDLKLSEAWMRGYIGGLPENF